jgi:hypothetical protein
VTDPFAIHWVFGGGEWHAYPPGHISHVVHDSIDVQLAEFTYCGVSYDTMQFTKRVDGEPTCAHCLSQVVAATLLDDRPKQFIIDMEGERRTFRDSWHMDKWHK